MNFGGSGGAGPMGGGGGGGYGRCRASVPKMGEEPLGPQRPSVPKPGGDFSLHGNRGLGGGAVGGSGGGVQFGKQYNAPVDKFVGMRNSSSTNVPQKTMQDYQRGWAQQDQSNNQMFGYSHH